MVDHPIGIPGYVIVRYTSKYESNGGDPEGSRNTGGAIMRNGNWAYGYREEPARGAKRLKEY